MKYRADIDGLRALAVLPVVLFHARVPGISGGFVGVDVFFVISGYLICSLIATEIAERRFSIVDFYERRCRRIFPALFLMLTCTTALAAFVLLPSDMKSFAGSLAATALFGSNVYFWRTSNYFDTSSEFKPLLHTWSLGVEEQFYIFMPIILLLIHRRSGSKFRRWLLPLGAISLVLAVWGVHASPIAAFYLLPFRFWELTLGAIVAVAPWRPAAGKAEREVVGLLGILLILGSVAILTEESPFPGWNAVYPCIGAAAILWSGERQSSISKVFNRPVLVFIGRISYSLYLWHWPLLALAKSLLVRPLTVFETTAIVAVSFVAATASWRYCEMPIRRQRGRFDWRLIFSGSAVCVLGTVLIGLGSMNSGFAGRFPSFVQKVIPGRERFGDGTCFLDGAQRSDEWSPEKCFLTRGRGPVVVLWGDSFAAHYAPGIVDQSASFRADVVQYTASACPPVFGYENRGRPYCKDFNDRLPVILKSLGSSEVVMAARWESALRQGVSTEAIVGTVERLRAMGIRVTVIGQSPVFYADVQAMLFQARRLGRPDVFDAPITFDASINTRLSGVLPANTFVDPLPTFCGGTMCSYQKYGKFLFVDFGHLSTAGSDFAVASYFPHSFQ